MGDGPEGESPVDPPPVVTQARMLNEPPPPRASRADPAAEKAALACIQRKEREQALTILMTAYGKPILAFAMRVVRRADLAEEVRQRTFLDAFQELDRFQGRGSLWSWLCGIAHHRCMDELRRDRRTANHDDFDVLEALAAPPDPLMTPSLLPSTRRALEDCLGALPAEVRSQVLMRYLLDHSFVEIGDAIDEPQGTVQVRMARALTKLQRCLRRKGVEL
jgi:RNA polymerase sigma-70 factor (ECF subfamily)